MDNKRPLILISNDDGYHFNGIHSLIKVAQRYGDLFVAAPVEHQSGKSSAISLDRPVRAQLVEQREGFTAYEISGTPADCVKLAISQLMTDRKPDLVLAGINHGFNMGISTLYSGTMACVYEGIMHGVPSVAFSYGLHGRETVTTGCEPLVDQVLQRVLKGGLPKDVCLNVNIPPMTEHPVKGLKVTISDLGRWVNEWEKRDHPMGGNYYWMTGDYEMLDDNDDRTDMYWLRRHYATVTPCHIDQTDYQSLKAVSDLLL
jgi:5'-nucleotidase